MKYNLNNILPIYRILIKTDEFYLKTVETRKQKFKYSLFIFLNCLEEFVILTLFKNMKLI